MTANGPVSSIPLPQPTPSSRPFWEACRRAELVVQRCTACGTYIFIPMPCCTQCGSSALEWTPTSGKGSIYSYTVVWRPQQPAFETPYIVVIVAMQEGWFMTSNLVDCPMDEVTVGLPVEVSFQPMPEEITLPLFRPAQPT